MARRRKKKAGIFRWISRLVILSLILLLGIVVYLFFNLNSVVKKGIETFGPEATQCTVEVDSVSILPFTGSGTISGLKVGNPNGFDSPNAIHMNEASVTLDTASLMSDKVIIHSIKVIHPEITLEGAAKNNNLTTILDNIDAYIEKLGLAMEDGTVKEPTKLQIDEIKIVDAVVKLELPIFRGKTVDVPLKDIHLTNLGQGPDGITGAELTAKALTEILAQATLAIPKKIAEFGLDGLGIGMGAGDAVKKGVGGLFNKLKGD